MLDFVLSTETPRKRSMGPGMDPAEIDGERVQFPPIEHSLDPSRNEAVALARFRDDA
jgi:hypothetical protein